MEDSNFKDRGRAMEFSGSFRCQGCVENDSPCLLTKGEDKCFLCSTNDDECNFTRQVSVSGSALSFQQDDLTLNWFTKGPDFQTMLGVDAETQMILDAHQAVPSSMPKLSKTSSPVEKKFFPMEEKLMPSKKKSKSHSKSSKRKRTESPPVERPEMSKADIPALELEFCAKILEDIRNNAFHSWAFLHPMESTALGTPTDSDTSDINHDAIYLGTMRIKLERDEYQTAGEFENDFRLMLNNCSTTNASTSAVYEAGKMLDRIFNAKWEEKDGWVEDAMKSGTGYKPTNKPAKRRVLVR